MQCTGSREKGWQINYVMKGKIDVMPACDYNFPTLQEAREAIFNCLHFPLGLFDWCGMTNFWRTPRLQREDNRLEKIVDVHVYLPSLMGCFGTPMTLKIPWSTFWDPFDPQCKERVVKPAGVKLNAFFLSNSLCFVLFIFTLDYLAKRESGSCWRQRICWCVCGTPLWPGPASLEPLHTFYTNYSQLTWNPFSDLQFRHILLSAKLSWGSIWWFVRSINASYILYLLYPFRIWHLYAC